MLGVKGDFFLNVIKINDKKLSLEIEERLCNYILLIKKLQKNSWFSRNKIGEDPASGVYVSNKEKACSRLE